MSSVPGHERHTSATGGPTPWARFVATLVLGGILLGFVVLLWPGRPYVEVCLEAAGIERSELFGVREVTVADRGAHLIEVGAELLTDPWRAHRLSCVVEQTPDGPAVRQVAVHR